MKPIMKNSIEEGVEIAAINVVMEYQAYVQLRTSNEPRKQGIYQGVPHTLVNLFKRHVP
jgi:hypothetical protein